MSIREAVSQQQAAAVAVQQNGQAVSPATALRRSIEQLEKEFQTVMPKGEDAKRYTTLVHVAVKSSPELIECFGTPAGRLTVIFAAMQAAALGLEPNTPTQECWLLPRWNNKTRATECQLSIGYAGWVKLGAENEQEIVADVVREGDHFRHGRTLHEEIFEHEAKSDDAPLTHAYAIIRDLKTGRARYKVLHRGAIEKRRDMSESWKSEKGRPHSPWTKWEDEMWMKSPIHAMRRFLRLSGSAQKAFEVDDQALTMDDNGELVAQQIQELPNEPIDVTISESRTAIDPTEPVQSPQTEQVEATPQEAAQDLSGRGEDAAMDVGRFTEAAPASAEAPTGQLPPKEVLAAVMREREIVGPKRIDAIEAATGARPKWSDVTDEQAQATIAHLESQLL